MVSREEESLPPPGWNTIIKELARGLDSLDKLTCLLQLGSPENRLPGSAMATLLVEEVRGTISKAMAELAAGNIPMANQADSPSCVTGDRQRTAGKRKLQSTRTAGYRRRGSPHSYRRISSTNIDDGHTWRKYGQKDIFCAKYPRCYFRCSYKFDLGCKASKQVQRSEEDPSLFIITYFGEHTCVGVKKATPSPRETCTINCESKNEGNVGQHALPSLSSLKQESEEEVLSNVSSSDSPSDFFVSADVEFKESGTEHNSQGIVAEHNESSSSSLSSCFNYGMDFVNFADFDFFNLDYSDFFQD